MSEIDYLCMDYKSSELEGYSNPGEGYLCGYKLRLGRETTSAVPSTLNFTFSVVDTKSKHDNFCELCIWCRDKTYTKCKLQH